MMRNVYALYLGWVIAATNINFGMDLVYFFGVAKETQMLVFWIVAPICAVGVFAFSFIR